MSDSEDTDASGATEWPVTKEWLEKYFNRLSSL